MFKTKNSETTGTDEQETKSKIMTISTNTTLNPSKATESVMVSAVDPVEIMIGKELEEHTDKVVFYQTGVSNFTINYADGVSGIKVKSKEKYSKIEIVRESKNKWFTVITDNLEVLEKQQVYDCKDALNTTENYDSIGDWIVKKGELKVVKNLGNENHCFELRTTEKDRSVIIEKTIIVEKDKTYDLIYDTRYIKNLQYGKLLSMQDADLSYYSDSKMSPGYKKNEHKFVSKSTRVKLVFHLSYTAMGAREAAICIDNLSITKREEPKESQ